MIKKKGTREILETLMKKELSRPGEREQSAELRS